MASVKLDRCYLAMASDLANPVAAFSTDRAEVLSAPGEVRRMANGRLRTVTRKGTSTSLSVTLRLLTPTQVATLRSWTGQTLLFRDKRGRKLYCAYFTVGVKDYVDPTIQDVVLSLSEVSFSEAA